MLAPVTSATTPAAPVADRAGVRVAAAGRLHLGFLDPAGTLGRRFGSIGLVIDGWQTVVELRPAARDALHAADAAAQAELDRAAAHLRRLRDVTGLQAPLALSLPQVLPAHAGFGSGTQLALAVGRAFARLHGLEVPTPTLAAWLGRGLRSGIGIAGFDAGGLIVDGGPAADGRPAPVLARLALPPAWRVIVATDPARRGLSGAEEREAMSCLAPFTQAQAADLCHQVLMRVLPGAAGDEFPAFAAGLNHVQQLLGDHFAPAQQGSAWTSPAVGRLMNWLRAKASAGIGQSSWGPTGFAVVPSPDVAAELVAAARTEGIADASLDLRVVGVRSGGADLTSLS